MKLPEKCVSKINHLIDLDTFDESTKKSILKYTPYERLFILMLSPYIPLSIRKQAVLLYGMYLEPSFKLPNTFILSFIEAFDTDDETFLKTLTQISKTKLIIY